MIQLLLPFELPCVGKAMWGLNNLELADNPEDTPVRKLVGDAISASYAQVNLRSYTRDALGTPRALGKHNRGHGENCSITRLSMYLVRSRNLSAPSS
jgi:hypothetical protein